MNKIKQQIAARLAPQQKAGISSILRGIRMFFGTQANGTTSLQERNMQSVDALFKKSILPDELINAIAFARHDLTTPDHIQSLSRLFTTIAVRPKNFELLQTSYFSQRFSEDNGYIRLLGAYHYGLGDIESAFQLYSALFKKTDELIDFIFASNCLIRPSGQEARALEFLQSGESKFGTHPLYFLNLAAAYFVNGRTQDANSVLTKNKGKWEVLLGVDSEDAIALASELDAAIKAKVSERKTHYDETIYTESAIWAHWAPYYTDMELDPEQIMFGWLSRAYENQIEATLVANSPVDCVIDFGVMCASPHYRVAKRHPALQIYGVDRQVETAKLNSLAFQDARNLHFIASDIEDFLDSEPAQSIKNGVLFHARTATLCYPEKMLNLYKQARAKGIRQIILFENMTLSRGARQYLDFSDFPSDAVTFKNHQFIHNYPSLLRQAGYTVVQEKRLFSPLITPFSTDDLGSTHVFLRAELTN
jgi:hypothetical protein